MSVAGSESNEAGGLTRARAGWLAAAVVACAVWGPAFVASLQPPRDVILDFFQEWASARNAMAGVPVYSPQSVALERHLGYRLTGDEPFWLEWNAHPPSAVLLIMPLAVWDYPAAFLAWNLLSLAALAVALRTIGRELALPCSWWWLPPLVTVLLACNPFRQQINQGQLNLVLLLLLTWAWAADRAGNAARAGLLIGAAAAVKLFPGFLLLYFAARGQWRAVAAGVASLAALTGLTALVLGVDAYRDYVQQVMPQVVVFRDWWANASLWGFWHKLFDGGSGHVVPMMRAPWLAQGAAAGCSLLVAGAVAWCARRAEGRRQQDTAFGLAVIGMLLVSPITWDHYFLLLLLPLAVLWPQLPPERSWRYAWWAILVLLCLNPKVVWDRTIAGPGELLGGVAQPTHATTVLAYQSYTLLALFTLGVLIFRRGRSEPADAA